MTFVGKILVIVIMAFALLFLGISTVVFTTHTNWKEATKKERDRVSDLQKKSSELTNSLETAKKDLEKAQADHKSAISQGEARIKSLEDEIKQAQAEITAARSRLEVAEQSANTALAEAAQRRAETDQIRTQKSAVEKQANEFKIQQTDLIEKVRELERQNKTLDGNNRDLRDRVARFTTLLRRNGLSDDISTVKGTETPPPVQGEVAEVDPTGRKVKFTLGSDDGILAGHELYVYRVSPRPEYLGRIQVQIVDPDTSSAR